YGLQSIYKVIQLIGPCCWRYWRGNARGARIFWPTDEPLPSARTWGIAVATAIGLSGLGILGANWIVPGLGIDPQAIRRGFDERFTVGPAGALLVVAFLSLVNSALEELHFRAWLDRELSVRWNSWVGILISAGAFGAMHILIFLGMPGLPRAAVVLVPFAL